MAAKFSLIESSWSKHLTLSIDQIWQLILTFDVIKIILNAKLCEKIFSDWQSISFSWVYLYQKWSELIYFAWLSLAQGQKYESHDKNSSQ